MPDEPRKPEAESKPAKKPWSTPRLTLLDVDETASGAPSVIEETPATKLGS